MLRKLAVCAVLFFSLGLAARAQSPSVALQWTASATSGVTYSVYRFEGTACPATTTGFTKINSGVTTTTYSDATGLTVGQTVCYYVTAVSTSSGLESSPSNISNAVLLQAPPAPPSGAAAKQTS